ncbi:MAG TPA: hypothetical protein VEU06_06375 [Micropepsaceae bacterium]|nr:hypothetical protein [Micropepsaceae bacterium]
MAQPSHVVALRALSILLLVVAVLSFLLMLVDQGWSSTFRLFHVPPLQPVFADLRTISGAWISQSQGLDPYVANPGDPWARPLNYPPIWSAILRAFSAGGDPVLILGTLQAIAMIAIAFRASLLRRGYLATLLLLSPPILLLIERGNTDSLVFALVLAAFSYGSFGGGVVMGLAVALKLYPVAGMLAGFAFPPRRAFAFGAATALPLIAWSLAQVVAILRATPAEIGVSFGLYNFLLLLLNPSAWFASYVSPAVMPSLLLRGLALCAFVLTAGSIWLLARSSYKDLFQRAAALSPPEKRIFFGFLFLFLAIFCASPNSGYRIVFLLPVIWGFALLDERGRGAAAKLFLAFGVLLMYSPFIDAQWLVFNCFAFLYALFLSPLVIEAVVSGRRRSAVGEPQSRLYEKGLS